jgi:hypothetical protein
MEGIKQLVNRIGDKLKLEYEIIFGSKSKDKNYISSKEYNTEEEAKNAFSRSVEKLFDVEKWSKLPGIASTFELYGKDGAKKSSKKPAVGDHLRILIPGPMPENWVEVIDLKRSENVASFTVKPDLDPQERFEKDVEHFFSDNARSTFKVERKGKVIEGCEIGESEDINNDGVKAGRRKVVNIISAEAGWVIFQEIQWRKLADYLVHRIEIKNP